MIELINEISPNHTRTSCSDENSNGNEYFNEFGVPRCPRCCLLHRVKNGEWPHGAEPQGCELYLNDLRVT